MDIFIEDCKVKSENLYETCTLSLGQFKNYQMVVLQYCLVLFLKNLKKYLLLYYPVTTHNNLIPPKTTFDKYMKSSFEKAIVFPL